MKFVIKAKGQTYLHESDEEVITIGRSPDNSFVIALEDFSRHHCKITRKGQYLFIMDLGSKNGIQIDGQKIPANEQIPLYPKNHILFANFFEFSFSESNQKSDSLKLKNLINKTKE